MIGCGIDIGSRTTKLVLYDKKKNKSIVSLITDSKLDKEETLSNLFNKALKKSNLKKNDIKKIIATGYGRELVTFAHETITEITCHAKGVSYLLPDTRSIIEIGGQDSKFIHLTKDNKVREFMMNDRCAAGTGRFLEMVAKLLEVDFSQMGQLALKAKNISNISSMCVVFAESEVIGLLSRKIPRSDIISGIFKSLAARVIALTGRNLTEPAVFTGGVALISGMAKALSEESSKNIIVVNQPQFTGALGAAILATSK